MLDPKIQQEIDDYMVGLFDKVIEVFEDADDDALASEIKPRVFQALGIREDA